MDRLDVDKLVEQKGEIKFKCVKEDGSNFTLNELIYVLETTENALKEYYETFYGIVDEEELKRLSPEIINVSNGCIELSAIARGVEKDAVVGLVTASSKRISAAAAGNALRLVYVRQNGNLARSHAFAFDGGVDLGRIGASFFVSYLYWFLLDPKRQEWKKIKKPRGRISRITSNRLKWKPWLREVMKMKASKLARNSLGLDPAEIQRMAKEILSVI